MDKHSVRISGHPTSISLEEPFWEALKHIAHEKNIAISALVENIESTVGDGNLSSALRVYVLQYYQSQLKS